MSTFILKTEGARDRMAAAWKFACRFLELGKSVKVTVEECQPTRTLEQNAKLWAMLDDVSRQVQWPVDGKLQLLDADDWKDIFTAALRKHQHIAQGIEGGFVMIGARTSKMRVGEMIELIELIGAFGAEHGVSWGDEQRMAA